MCGVEGGMGGRQCLFATYPGKPFAMPYQRAKLHKEFWPIREAARRWGCSYRAARLYLLRHPHECVMVRISNSKGRIRWIMTAKAGAAKKPAMTGNPDFLRPEWQRARAVAYWQKKKMPI